MKRLLITISIFNLLYLSGCINPEEVTENEKTESNEIDIQVNDESSSLLSPDRILNIAHRGASGHAPEHTLEAYQLGKEMNGDYIEIDLQMTKDGVLVALHDPDLARISNNDNDVNQLTIDEIKQIDAGQWFNKQFPELANSDFDSLTIPTLDEIITEFGHDTNYYIETKQPEASPEMVTELISVLNKNELIDQDIREGQIIIQSFSPESLKEVHELEPSLPIIQLISYQTQAEITNEQLNEIKKYAIGIGINYKFLSEEYVAQVRDAELLIHPYTVNEKADMEQLINWGVTGMFTNYPNRLDDLITQKPSE